MSITLSPELREAIERPPDRPLMFEDALTRTSYVLMTGEQFQRLIYDDSDLTPDEILAAASVSAALADADNLATGISSTSPSDP